MPARHFVEFPAGTLRRIGLKMGDRLGWNLALATASKVVGGRPGRRRAEAPATAKAGSLRLRRSAAGSALRAWLQGGSMPRQPSLQAMFMAR